MSFEGFAPGACAFFARLEAENTKAFWEANRDFWETGVRAPMEALVREAAAARGGRPKFIRPNRDVRFSKEKHPYKTATYGVIVPEAGAAGLFASIHARGFFAGTGYWDMAPDQTERWRAAVAADPGAEMAEIVAALEAAGLEIEGRGVKTAPRGFDKAHPRIRLIRMREITMGARIPPAEAEAGRRPADHAARIWDMTAPARMWLDALVGPSRMDPEEIWAKGRRR